MCSDSQGGSTWRCFFKCDDNKFEVILTCNFKQYIVELVMHSHSSLGLYICIVTLKLSGSCTFHMTAQLDASSSVLKIEPAHKPKLLPSLCQKLWNFLQNAHTLHVGQKVNASLNCDKDWN